MYNTPGTYTYNIVQAGNYLITLVGGGGGAAYTDGGLDSYSDTAWAHHYGKNGAGAGHFEGLAKLTPGTLQITVGSVGTNCAGKDVSSGNGQDSFIIFTPENQQPIEIARAYGGLSGYPSGSSYNISIPGSGVWYNELYFDKVYVARVGEDSTLRWYVKR